MMEGSVTRRFICPRCGAGLDAAVCCPSCGQAYPCLGSVAVLLEDPLGHVERWRRQLGSIVAHGVQSFHALSAQAGEPGLLAPTRTRLLGLARSIAEQIEDLARVLAPALGDPLPAGPEQGLPRGATDYIGYLFRDWGGASVHEAENARSLAAMARVSEGRALGRTLVLGAGGCRLPYDLRFHAGASEITALDLDPFLLLVAEAVVRGVPVSLTETSVNAPEVEPVSRRFALAPPAGPLGAEVFHFVLANGLKPPFADQTFETVVTPWFIDQVPTKLEALLAELRRVLVPGGRWINRGPLLYRPDVLPIARWYARAEIFELAARAGFRLGAWESEAEPHLVSALSGRGTIEQVLTFEATA